MKVLKENPVFAVTVGLLVLVAIAFAALAGVDLGKIKKLEKRVADQQRRYKDLAQNSDPANTQENLDKAKANLDALRSQYSTYIQNLAGGADGRGIAEGLPSTSLDLYFDLKKLQTDFQAEFRRRGEETRLRNIELKPDERPRVFLRPDARAFSFDYFIESGDGPPKEEDRRDVFVQRRVITTALQKLLGSLEVGVDDLAVEQVLRSPVLPLVGGKLPPGTFRIDPRVSAAVTDIVRTHAFQLRFIARTKTLRRFLNQLVAIEDMPLIVRSVEVQRYPDSLYSIDPSGRAAPRRGGDNPFGDPAGADAGFPTEGGAEVVQENKPIVTKTLSRFTVTFELIEIIQPSEDEADDGSDDADDA